MEGLSDDVLLEELKKRFLDNKKALNDLKVLNEKIEKLNMKLTESERLKTNFLSNIRNEINNPLTSILGMARELAEPARDENVKQVMARTIYEEAFALDFQLRNIFIAAELEAGEATVSCAEIDVRALIKRTIASSRHQADKRNITVTFDSDGNPDQKLLFSTDPGKLHLVVGNLLANAIEYSHPDTTVRIEAQRRDSTLYISVADDGIGIPDQERERLFERFHQLDRGASKKHPGHGLGLSITKALVELLRGNVSLEAIGSGGSLFRVVLPEAAVSGEVFSEDGNEFLFGGSAF